MKECYTGIRWKNW